MIEWMDNFLDNCLNMDLSQTTKFQCMEFLIVKLIEEGWFRDNAVKVVCAMEMEISDNAWENHKEDIERHLEKYAKVIEKLYRTCHYKLGMDVDNFINTFAKDLSYKMEI